jgi:CRISPR-associated protein Csb1
MPLDLNKLASAPRILIHAQLKPVAGTRIQPTGFPDLGAALYDDPNGVPTLLVESAQSMANRLEAVCWDEAGDDIASELKGLPFVRVNLQELGEGNATNSLLEFHRLNSPYIMKGKNAEGALFEDVLRPLLGLQPTGKAKKPKADRKAKDESPPAAGAETQAGEEAQEFAGVVNLRKLAEVCFRYDPNSLVHGVFLEKIAGRLRHPRALSAFIEATGVGRADSGGVKFDRALPNPKVANVDAKGGFGNVPFHRTEFTAREIVAYFSVDLAQLRGYGLPAEATELLVTLSLWKIRRFLESSMRLRSACELELVNGDQSILVRQPATQFALPTTEELSAKLRELIQRCKTHFASPVVTELTWTN